MSSIPTPLNKPLQYKRNLGTVSRMALRLILLNVLLLSLAYALGIIRMWIENVDSAELTFPFQLYITTLFLSNLIYIFGNAFEVIYLLLWGKEVNLRSFELKFFRIALVIALFVNLIGTTMYLIGQFI